MSAPDFTVEETVAIRHLLGQEHKHLVESRRRQAKLRNSVAVAQLTRQIQIIESALVKAEAGLTPTRLGG